MKNKNQSELILKVKTLEEKLSDKLKNNSFDFDEGATSSSVKSGLKKYIANVKEIKKLMAEYEDVTKQLIEISSKQQEECDEIVKAVVALRREPKVKKSEIEANVLDAKMQTPESKNDKKDLNKNVSEKTIIEFINGKPVAVKKTAKKVVSGKKEY